MFHFANSFVTAPPSVLSCNDVSVNRRSRSENVTMVELEKIKQFFERATVAHDPSLSLWSSTLWIMWNLCLISPIYVVHVSQQKNCLVGCWLNWTIKFQINRAQETIKCKKQRIIPNNQENYTAVTKQQQQQRARTDNLHIIPFFFLNIDIER